MSILKVKIGSKYGRYCGKFTPPSGGLITVYADSLLELYEEVRIVLDEETEKITVISYTPDND